MCLGDLETPDKKPGYTEMTVLQRLWKDHICNREILKKPIWSSPSYLNLPSPGAKHLHDPSDDSHLSYHVTANSGASLRTDHPAETKSPQNHHLSPSMCTEEVSSVRCFQLSSESISHHEDTATFLPPPFISFSGGIIKA
ncbi:uncharacterized protein LOC143676017 [Tamandua tetradactyla]|uniref:uncharacterized protein LOC143676017 n=1 Tax=Tamandua tetradactyla TaxID=48850 RepID=UPI004053C2C6